jgi:NADH-quinone oxidoreductase subunit A
LVWVLPEEILLADYGFIGLFLIVTILVAATMVLLPVLLRLIGIVPHKPNKVKNSTFECGMETIGKSWVRFNFRYYFYAIMFISLDVLVLFLYPWAAGLRELGFFSLGVIVVFLILISVGYLYAWKKKVLEWK